MSEPTLASIFNILNDANELQRERIELLTKEAASNRLENQEMRVTLQAQQKALEAQNAAIAAAQATGEKMANIIKKNLTSGIDSDSSSDELTFSNKGKTKAKLLKYRDSHRTPPDFRLHGLSSHVRTEFNMNSAKTYSNLYKETKNLFESESKLPTNLEQLGEFYPTFVSNSIDPHCANVYGL